MFTRSAAIRDRGDSLISSHKVLRNTYFLLSMTLIFSAMTAVFAMSVNAQPPGILLMLAGMFGLSFLTQALSKSAWGILAIFMFTGFMGYILGPILNQFIGAYANGGQLVMTALGATGLIFLSLSAYTLTTQRNFGFMGGMLFALGMVAFIGSLVSIFLQIALLQVMISGAFALFASGMILYETSAIIHGGQRNYILATISLYMALFNLFLSLLRILSFFAGGSRN
jgi:modulator of FtsH protease